MDVNGHLALTIYKNSYLHIVIIFNPEASIMFFFWIFFLMFQIVHRTLAAMLGSLAALAALAIIGDVSLFYSWLIYNLM